MVKIHRERPFRVVWPLMISQTIGAFNDNAMKAMLPAMAAVQFGKGAMDWVNQQVSILLILPFVLFAPLAGWISDRFSKKKVIRNSLLAQLLGLGILVFSFFVQSMELALTGFFLLSVQSAFFSPAKKGILKELVGSNRLGKAVGFMEMLAMVGILGGAFVGAVTFDGMVTKHGGWNAALIVCSLISALALFSWLISFPIPETDATRTTPFKAKVLVSHFPDLVFLLKDRGLRFAALGDAWFWGLGGFFYLVLVKLSGEVVVGKVGMGTLYGYWFLLLGLGIMIGSMFAAYLNRGRIELGLTPIGGMGMPFSFAFLYFVDPFHAFFDFSCLALGFFGALFFVPLNGYLQDQAKENERGKVLAATNLLTQLSGIFLILFHALLSNLLGLNAKQELLVILVPSLLIGLFAMKSLFEDFCRTCFLLILRLTYRIRIVGMENFPEKGGCLLVSNHLSYADPVLIGAAFPRKVRYLAYSGLNRSKLMRWIFRLTKTLTVSTEKSLGSIRASVRRLKAGTPLCVFAEGGISRIGVIMPFMRGPVVLAKQAKVPIVPVHLDRVWGSVFSMERGRFFNKFPLRLPYRVTVRVGSQLNGHLINQESCRNSVMDLGRESFKERMKKSEDSKTSLKIKMQDLGKEILWKGEDGLSITRESFVKEVFENKGQLPELLMDWAAEVRKVLDGKSETAEMYLCNLERMKETHYWDYQTLVVDLNSDSWLKQWLPWSGLLWGRKISMEAGKYRLDSIRRKNFHQELLVSGFSTATNGIVSINALSEEMTIGDEENHQALFKANTYGRILPGFSFREENGTFVLNGIRSEESFQGFSVDEDGFLFRKKID